MSNTGYSIWCDGFIEGFLEGVFEVLWFPPARTEEEEQENFRFVSRVLREWRERKPMSYPHRLKYEESLKDAEASLIRKCMEAGELEETAKMIAREAAERYRLPEFNGYKQG